MQAGIRSYPGTELGNHASGSNAPDLIGVLFGEPQVPVWTGRYPGRLRSTSNSYAEFSDRSSWGYASNSTETWFGEPEFPIWTGCDPCWLRTWADPGTEF